ncbi:hypothetical protein PUN28_019527 [Cardiocondyla obscurior]|uniref:Leucine-rich repeat protein n=1 Tax=Cardiocondyla obscurior TaxID=286306 RepID=A0AAW2EED2_9HYME
MKLIITLIFNIIFACWSTATQFPTYTSELYQNLYENNDFTLNFSNAVITEIGQNFISSPLITYLNLTGNYITNIDRGAFDKLPNLKQLYLSNNRLNSQYILNFGDHEELQILIINNATDSNQRQTSVLISDKYPSLKILSLRKNYIYRFYATHNPFPKLEILDLSENELLSRNLIDLSTSNLYFLDLHSNSLNYFSQNKLGKLITLNLNNNKFRYIRNTYNCISLKGLKSLLYFSVSNNQIVDIESNAFIDNNDLLYLNLSRNVLSSLYPEVFLNLPNLEVLDLSENNLNSFPQILTEMQITILYLYGNCIKELTPQIFQNIPKLKKLLLGDNQILEIDVSSFNGLYSLEKLDLSNNKLSFLPESWTKSLVSLKYLDLSNNQFALLESLSLTNNSLLTEVYLMMNPLEYLNVSYFENLPQNLTINLMNNSSFIKWDERNRLNCKSNHYYY